MATVTNPYDTLYTNLKNRYTVIYDGSECTVGEYMLKRAGHSAPESCAIAPLNSSERHGVHTLVQYVNEKFSVKMPPKKEKTIRRFPIHTSLSAVLSAVAACALILSCGIIALAGSFSGVSPLADNDDNYVVSEDDFNESEESEFTENK